MKPTILIHADARELNLLRLIHAQLGWTLAMFPDDAGEVLIRARIPFERAGEYMTFTPSAMQSDLDALEQQCRQAFGARGYPEFLGLTRKETYRYKRFIMSGLRRAFECSIRAIRVVGDIADRTDLRLLIVKHDHSHDTKPLTREAQRLGIPVLYVEHGLPGYNSKFPKTLFADKVAAYGPFSRHAYLAAGNDDSRIVITGNPAWDKYCRARDGDESLVWQSMLWRTGLGSREALRAKLGLDPDRPVIVYGSTWFNQLHTREITNHNAGERLFRDVLQAVRDLQRRRDVQLVVKVHPHPAGEEVAKEFPAIAREEGVNDLKLFHGPSEGLMVLADLLVNHESSLAVEAMLLNKPVVNYRGNQIDRSVEGVFCDDDAMLHVYEPNKLGQAIESALFSTEVRQVLDVLRPQSLYRYNYLCDGHADQRVVELIKEMVGYGTHSTAGMVSSQLHFEPPDFLSITHKWFHRGQTKWAELAANLALEHGEDAALAHYYRGCIRLGQQSAPDAVSEFTQAVEAAPDVADFHNALGGALQFTDDGQASEREFLRAVELDRGHVMALLNLADRCRARGEIEGSERWLEMASQAAPESADVKLSLAELLRIRGEWEAAKALFADVLQISPTDQRAWDGLLETAEYPAEASLAAAAAASEEKRVQARKLRLCHRNC